MQTLRQIFQESKNLVGEDVNNFYGELVNCVKGGMAFRGYTPEEVKKYLREENKCECGNETFNCLCGEDAE